MERSDFTRDDHRRALQDFVAVTTPDTPRSVCTGSEVGVVYDPLEAVHYVRSDFFKFGVVITLYDDDGTPAHSQILSPHATRVVAMQLLSSADQSERASKR